MSRVLDDLVDVARLEAGQGLTLDRRETDLAALYRACDVAVFPYRAEGFCIPILECMASGTPAIVPRFGACLDYCSDDTSYFTDAKRIRIPVHRRLTVALGFTDEVDEVDFCEVPVDVLAERMRQAMQGRADKQVYLRGDGAVRLQELMDVFGRLKEAGIEKVGIVAQERRAQR